MIAITTSNSIRVKPGDQWPLRRLNRAFMEKTLPLVDEDSRWVLETFKSAGASSLWSRRSVRHGDLKKKRTAFFPANGDQSPKEIV
jgi:hypothetical protein